MSKCRKIDDLCDTRENSYPAQVVYGFCWHLKVWGRGGGGVVGWNKGFDNHDKKKPRNGKEG